MIISDGQVATVPSPPGAQLSDETPLRVNAAFYPAGGLALTAQFASYAELYRRQLWVYVLARKLGISVARLRLQTFTRSADGSRQDAAGSPLGQLLDRPNPQHSAFFLWLWTQTTISVYGEAIWLKLRGDASGRPRELWPVHPSNLVTRRDADGNLLYVYAPGARASQGEFAVPAADVVHFRDYNPHDTVRGLSPLEPLRQTLLTEDASRRAIDAQYRNGSRPSVVLTTPQTLSEAAGARLKAQWDSIHSGVDSWSRTAVLEQGVTPHAMQTTPEDMQYLGSRQLAREECCAAYDVPPPVVHILDRATFSNITEQMRSMYRDTMAPRLSYLEAELRHQLVPDFGDDTIFGAFSLDDVLRGSYEVRTTAKAQAIATGQLTPNESRREENMPDLPGGDTLLVNAALIPLAVTEAVSHGTGTDVEESPQKIKGLSAGETRLVVARLHGVTDLADVDPQGLTRGLTDPSDVRAHLAGCQSRGEGPAVLRSRLLASAGDVLELDAGPPALTSVEVA